MAACNEHSAFILDVHRGWADSMSGSIFEILSTNFLSSKHIKQ